MTTKIVLSINAGSSSLKTAAYQISTGTTPQKLASATLDNLNSSEQITLKHDTKHPKKESSHKSGTDSINDFNSDSLDEAFELVLKHLTGDDGPVEIQSTKDISFVAHRVVHGGESTSPRVLDDELLEYVEELSDLAPL
jgi:acetate kinase